MMKNRRTVLVTGGCGFIGANFIHLLLSEYTDWRVINLDKLTYAGNLKNLQSIADRENYRFIKGDICDAATVNAIFSDEKIDTYKK